jgi:hypothetical protein
MGAFVRTFPVCLLPRGKPRRGRLRASIHVQSLDGRALPLVAPSLEVFAADTGRSTLFYPGAFVGLL